MYQTYLYQLYSQLILPELFENNRCGHGSAHSKRVLYLALIIAESLNLTEDEYKILSLACCYHDIGRIRDGKDPEHGELSRQKVISLNLLDQHDLNPNDQDLVLKLIQTHSLSDSEFDGQGRELLLYQALKDADALDRVRFWDLDVKYLRLPISKSLIRTASNLLLKIRA